MIAGEEGRGRVSRNSGLTEARTKALRGGRDSGGQHLGEP